MAHSIATMRSSTREQRRNRKQSLFARIERQATKYMAPDQAKRYLCSIRSDLHELMEIGHVEGYQCGVNDTNQKGKEQ